MTCSAAGAYRDTRLQAVRERYSNRILCIEALWHGVLRYGTLEPATDAFHELTEEVPSAYVANRRRLLFRWLDDSRLYLRAMGGFKCIICRV